MSVMLALELDLGAVFRIIDANVLSLCHVNH